MNRSRNWCFTLNNYTEEDEKRIIDLEGNKQVKYLICGKEVGEQGTPHLQGFIVFNNAKTFNQVVKFMDNERYHIEKAIGSVKQNIAYCSKDEDYAEFGDEPQQGSRNDIKEVKEKVQKGFPLDQIISESTSYQSARHAELLYKYQKQPECKKRDIRWYWGATGTGKTRTAVEESGDSYYITMKDLKWWDGYTGQKTIIIDDFRKDFCTFHELLRILDRYPYRVQYKGGSMWLQFSTDIIIVTSAYSPDHVYSTREDVSQLIRRIDVIREFK